MKKNDFFIGFARARRDAPLLLLILLLAVGGARAAQLTEQVAGGQMILTYPSDLALPGANLGGSADIQTGDSQATFAVEDSRGTGDGWNIVFTCTQFQVSGSASKALPVTAFKSYITSGDITKVFGQDIDSVGGPKSLVTVSTNIYTTEVKMVQAQIGYGKGKYNILPNFNILVPASAYSGTYNGTITATLNAAP